MSPGAWVALLWWTIPSPGPLPESACTSEWSGFPVLSLASVCRTLPATFHGRADWGRAVFLGAAPAGDPLPAPRLVLGASSYGFSPSLDALSVDAAEHLLAAELEAALAVDAEAASRIRERARALAGDWPQEVAEESVRTALAEMGSHVLSLALEIRRSVGRLRGRGVDACELARQRLLIFGLWPRALDPSAYRLQRPGEGARGAGGPALEPADGDWLVRSFLGRDWIGDPAADLDLGCGPEPAPEASP